MSLGLKLGRAIGAGAALVGEGAVRTALGAGRFGNDLVEGTQLGYAEQAAKNLASRAAGVKRREEAVAAFKAKQALAVLGNKVEMSTPVPA